MQSCDACVDKCALFQVKRKEKKTNDFITLTNASRPAASSNFHVLLYEVYRNTNKICEVDNTNWELKNCHECSSLMKKCGFLPILS